MTDYVVDTNVWIMVDKPLTEAHTLAELDCIEAAQKWIQAFMKSAHRLVVDDQYQILGEYRRNITDARPQAFEALNQLESTRKKPPLRLHEVTILFDPDGYALLPANLVIQDKSDRKFVAVSLQCNPPAEIINATDTDWDKDQLQLQAVGINVKELCPAYIQHKLQP